jgi:ankyrin repeat protein
MNKIKILFLLAIFLEPVHADPLIEAASKGNLPEVKRLIESDANVNATGTSGETALLMAVMNRHWTVAKELVKSGADINASIDNKFTATLLAYNRYQEDLKNDEIRLVPSAALEFLNFLRNYSITNQKMLSQADLETLQNAIKIWTPEAYSKLYNQAKYR